MTVMHFTEESVFGKKSIGQIHEHDSDDGDDDDDDDDGDVDGV